MTFPACIPPPPPAVYIPRVFGFRVRREGAGDADAAAGGGLAVTASRPAAPVPGTTAVVPSTLAGLLPVRAVGPAGIDATSVASAVGRAGVGAVVTTGSGAGGGGGGAAPAAARPGTTRMGRIAEIATVIPRDDPSRPAARDELLDDDDEEDDEVGGGGGGGTGSIDPSSSAAGAVASSHAGVAAAGASTGDRRSSAAASSAGHGHAHAHGHGPGHSRVSGGAGRGGEEGEEEGEGEEGEDEEGEEEEEDGEQEPRDPQRAPAGRHASGGSGGAGGGASRLADTVGRMAVRSGEQGVDKPVPTVGSGSDATDASSPSGRRRGRQRKGAAACALPGEAHARSLLPPACAYGGDFVWAHAAGSAGEGGSRSVGRGRPRYAVLASVPQPHARAAGTPGDHSGWSSSLRTARGDE